MDKVQRILQLISAIKTFDEGNSGYAVGKRSIKKVFEAIDGKSHENILARLTVIDSVYSTQMGRRYYGLEELAEVLANLQKKRDLSVIFLSFLQDKDIREFTTICNGKEKNLFLENYGIGKNGNDKGHALSLITKYAYFETKCNFPIYDSIVREMYPLIWNYCGLPKKEMPKMRNVVNNITAFIESIELLKKKLGGPKELTYDSLDRLLWYTGKILRGNLSLILTMEEYIQYGAEFNKKDFILSNYNLSEMKFLDKNNALKSVFEFAKEISNL
ncbi:MAG: hypothetical protein IKO90_05755 [Bacteroidales bacterium]|nr:hypothetical protein [Bacteroidales bacterium]